MNKFFLTLAVMTGFTVSSYGCTNFIVGKAASADGSVMCSYSADDYGMFQSLCHYPAGIHPKGTMRKIYNWDTNEYQGQIPEARQTYNVVGNINEFQVTIAETTFGGRPEMVQGTAKGDPEKMQSWILQKAGEH